MSIQFGTNPASALLADSSLTQLSYPFTVVAHIKVTNANASISSVFGLGHSDGNIKPVKFSLSPLSGVLSVQNNYGNNPYTHGTAYADTAAIYAAGWQLVYMQFDSATQARHYFNGVEESVTTFERGIETDKVFPFVGYGSRNRVEVSHFAVFNEVLTAFAKSELHTRTPDNISGHTPIFYKPFVDDISTGIGPALTDVLDDVVIDGEDNPTLTAAPAVNPAFTAQPTVANIGESTVDVRATSDEDCTAQVVMTAQGAGQPTDTVFNGGTSTTANADTQFTVNVTGLSGLTDYTAWVRLKPVNGNSAYASVDFQTTPAAPTIGSVAPATLRVDSTVTVTGSGFTGHTAASIDGIAQDNFAVIDDSTVEFTLVRTGVRHGETAVLNIGGTATNITVLPALGRTFVDIAEPLAPKAERFDFGQTWDIIAGDQVEYETKGDDLVIHPDGKIELDGDYALPTSLIISVFDSTTDEWSPAQPISLPIDSDDADVTPPTISLNGANPTQLAVGQQYIELGATWSDDQDGTGNVTNINGTVDVNTVGSYSITYDFSDAAGNAAAQVTRTVIISDLVPTVAPTIDTGGQTSTSIEADTSYSDPAWTASDDLGTVPVTWSGVVDTSTPGTYTRTATATNDVGTTTEDYTVEILEPAPPIAQPYANPNAPMPATIILPAGGVYELSQHVINPDSAPLIYFLAPGSAALINGVSLSSSTGRLSYSGGGGSVTLTGLIIDVELQT